MEPRKFGRYEIKSELGRGGMATVFHAYDPRFQRDVALKVIPREFLHDPTFKSRFEREAQTIAGLEHPAIVPVYDSGEEDGQPYLVMRFLPGGSLTDRLERGKLSLAETIRILQPLTSALDEAHRQGIIHRDLKPDNILFDQRNDPFITDFGIAKLVTEQSSLTSASLIIGTPSYMSPEQANGQELDGRSDIYALGVILFEMLTGELPYQANTPIGIIMQHINQPIPNILQLNPDLPPGCETVIARAMAKARADRYATATALVAALVEAPNAPAPPQVDRDSVQTSRLRKLPTQEQALPSPPPAADQLICPKCGAANTDQTRFCANCHTQLKLDCPLCYTVNPAEANQCTNCGADLQELRLRQQALHHVRKSTLAKRDQAFKEKAARQLREKLDELLADLNSRRKRDTAARQLDQLRDSALKILAEDMVIDHDPDARYDSAKMLSQLFERVEIDIALRRHVTQAFIDALQDSDPRVRQQVQRELEKLSRKRPREISDIFKGFVGWLKGDQDS
jgi:serine/threonine-protein kinase